MADPLISGDAEVDVDQQPAATLEILEQPEVVIDVEVTPTETIEVEQTEAIVVEVIEAGPQGPIGPGVPPDVVAEQVQALVAGYLQQHPAQVYVFEEPTSTWPLPHAFGRIPAVTLYSLTGRQIRTDVDADEHTASARFPYPVPGFAVLT